MSKLFSSTFLRSITVILGAFVVVALAVRASHTSTTIGTNVVTGNVTAHDVTGSGALSITGASTLTGNVTAAGDLAVNGGDITSSATTWNFDVGSTGTIRFRDGTNNLMTIADAGTTGNVTVTGTLTVDGASTLTGNVTASGALAVTGALTNAADKTDGRIWIAPGECIYARNDGSAEVMLDYRATFNASAYVSGKTTTLAASTAYVVECDITNAVRRTTASKGVKVNSFDVIYGISNTALASHSVALQKITFANNTAPTIAAFSTLTGTPATATQALPYLTTYTVDSAAVHVTDDEKLAVVISLTTGGGGGSQYDFWGIMLNVDYNYL